MPDLIRGVINYRSEKGWITATFIGVDSFKHMKHNSWKVLLDGFSRDAVLFSVREPLISSLLITLRYMCVCLCVCESLISEPELGAVDEMSGKPVKRVRWQLDTTMAQGNCGWEMCCLSAGFHRPPPTTMRGDGVKGPGYIRSPQASPLAYSLH